MKVKRNRDVFVLVVIDSAIRKYPHPWNTQFGNGNGLETEEIYP